MNSQPCVSCKDGTMTFRVKDREVKYKDSSTTVPTKAWWCDKCDEGILDHVALLTGEKAYKKLKEKAEGYCRDCGGPRVFYSETYPVKDRARDLTILTIVENLQCTHCGLKELTESAVSKIRRALDATTLYQDTDANLWASDHERNFANIRILSEKITKSTVVEPETYASVDLLEEAIKVFKNRQKTVYVDPAEQARETQLTKDAHELSLAFGHKTEAQRRRENGFIPPEVVATSTFDPRDFLK